jgi:chromosome segregation ATPase
MTHKILKFGEFKAGISVQDPKKQGKASGGVPKTEKTPKIDSVKRSGMSQDLEMNLPDYTQTRKEAIDEAASDQIAQLDVKRADLMNKISALNKQSSDFSAQIAQVDQQKAALSAQVAAEAAKGAATTTTTTAAPTPVPAPAKPAA